MCPAQEGLEALTAPFLLVRFDPNTWVVLPMSVGMSSVYPGGSSLID